MHKTYIEAEQQDVLLFLTGANYNELEAQLLPCSCGHKPLLDVSMALIHCTNCGTATEYRYNWGVIPFHTWQLSHSGSFVVITHYDEWDIHVAEYPTLKEALLAKEKLDEGKKSTIYQTFPPFAGIRAPIRVPRNDNGHVIIYRPPYFIPADERADILVIYKNPDVPRADANYVSRWADENAEDRTRHIVAWQYVPTILSPSQRNETTD